MTDQYQNIGETFQEVAARALLRTDLLTPSFMAAVGDVHGKSCFDLACGDGHYTRLLRQAGANPVVGVDISQKMIDLAEAENERLGGDIVYQVGDVARMPVLGVFDYVTAVFLLHYAASKQELAAMTESIAAMTAPDGQFITLNTNPDFPIREDNRYTFTRTGPDPLQEGDTLTLTQFQGQQPMYSFNFFHWSKETYTQALQQAGFTSVQWLTPQPVDSSVARYGQAFWQDYMDQPNQSIIVCHK